MADRLFDSSGTEAATAPTDEVLQSEATDARGGPVTPEKFSATFPDSGFAVATSGYVNPFALGGSERTPRESALNDEIWHRTLNSYASAEYVWGGYTGLAALATAAQFKGMDPAVAGAAMGKAVIPRIGNALFATGGAAFLNGTSDMIFAGLTGHSLPTAEQSHGLQLLDTVTYAAAGLAAMKFKPLYVMLAATGVHAIGRSVELYNAP